MDNNIPQWVIDYNNAGHQSSAGRAINILMSELTRLRSELQQEREKVERAKTLLQRASRYMSIHVNVDDDLKTEIIKMCRC